MSTAIVNSSAHLTGGRLLAKNTLWNLLGTGAPALVAIFAIPILIKGIGIPRFGVLTLVWTVIGYFSLFDFGLGATLTRMVADRLGAGKPHEIPPLFWTSLAFMALLAVAGSLALFGLSPLLVHSVLKIPADLQAESARGFALLAACLPIIITTTGLRGTLEAQQKFGLVNAIRIPMGIITFAGPLVVLPFSRSLVPVIAVLATGRMIAWSLYFIFCLKSLPLLSRNFAFERRLVGYVVRFGGWMTISNIISPLMMYMDRVVIGSMVSVAAVAFYATPFEAVSKLLLIPAALAGVLFPAFAVSHARDDGRMAMLLRRGLKYLMLMVFPICVLIVLLASDGLRLWLGTQFAVNSATVLRWLAVGVFINCLGQLPWVLIQGAGRPDLTAKLHMIEFPLYLATLWFMVKTYGIHGAAIAWTGRVFLDSALLLFVAQRFLPGKERFLGRISVAALGALTILLLAFLPATLLGKVSFAAVISLMLVGATWFFFFAPEERLALRDVFTPRRGLPRSQPERVAS